MKIRFVRSGGIGGVSVGCEIDTDLMPIDKAAELEGMVNLSGILDIKKQNPWRIFAVRPAGCDLMGYHIRIEKGRDVRDLKLVSVPAGARDLFRFLVTHSVPVPGTRRRDR